MRQKGMMKRWCTICEKFKPSYGRKSHKCKECVDETLRNIGRTKHDNSNLQ
jgi:hypothetical protein